MIDDALDELFEGFEECPDPGENDCATVEPGDSEASLVRLWRAVLARAFLDLSTAKYRGDAIWFFESPKSGLVDVCWVLDLEIEAVRHAAKRISAQFQRVQRQPAYRRRVTFGGEKTPGVSRPKRNPQPTQLQLSF